MVDEEGYRIIAYHAYVPIGLYVANAVLGPTVGGLSWAACAAK